MTTIKSHLQTLLKGIGLYERLKVSPLYDLYWRMADRRTLQARDDEVRFYSGLLEGFEKGDLIFDIGANHGYKTDIFLRLGARVIAVEPDEFCQDVIKEKLLRLRFAKKPVTVLGKAVSDSIRTETMWVDAPGSALNSLNEKWVSTLRADDTRFGRSLKFERKREVETITLEGLIAAYGLPFFVKIDVEGHEENVLRGLAHAVPYLSFEVNLPEFLSEGMRCVALLATLAPEGKFNYAADCAHGLKLEYWLGHKEFMAVLNECTEQGVEVFWKTAHHDR